eukprot:289081-Karenia_brevis.AAC.1
MNGWHGCGMSKQSRTLVYSVGYVASWATWAGIAPVKGRAREAPPVGKGASIPPNPSGGKGTGAPAPGVGGVPGKGVPGVKGEGLPSFE